jgi:hypothetical protein
MSDENWIVPETPVYVLCNPPEDEDRGYRWGLLWGSGDPSLAHLQSFDYWAVVRVKSCRDMELGGPLRGVQGL